MRLTDEQAMQDNKRFANSNVLAELKYCGFNIPHRKSITNDEIHFYAWLCRSAVTLLKEQEAVEPKTEDAWPSRIKTCGACGTCLFTVGDYKPKYCSECGRAVKWNA